MAQHFSAEEANAITAVNIFDTSLWPWDKLKIEPKLYIYGKGNRYEYITITHNLTGDQMVEMLLDAGLLPTNRFIFVTHGYRSNGKTEWIQKLKNSIVDNSNNETVAILDWGKGADPAILGVGLNYILAAMNAQIVGEWVAKYAMAIAGRNTNQETILQQINPLNMFWGLTSVLTSATPSKLNAYQNSSQKPKIWGIGHSLGAHLMGKAGRVSQVFTRITGLDPAGPGFEKANQDIRLNKKDAKLVDVIHTDGHGTIHFGTLVPLGTIDFYPSYGWSQPGTSGSLTESHSRAVDYFIWSIKNKEKFVTIYKIDSPKEDNTTPQTRNGEEAEMGYYADIRSLSEMPKTDPIDPIQPKRLCYYINVNSSEPWA